MLWHLDSSILLLEKTYGHLAALVAMHYAPFPRT